MSDDLAALENWAAPLLAKLEPTQRRQLARLIALDLRRTQQRRIASQRNPDGSPYVPRKQRARDKVGRIKRGAMFRKIRQAKFLKVTADARQATVGFIGRVARIARVHQEGGLDAINRRGRKVRYDRRELLGFTPGDRERIRELLIDHLTK